MKYFYKDDILINKKMDGSEIMKYFIKEWVMPVLVALIIVLLLNKFIFILVTVPTGSMEDTIIPGDRLYVNEIFDISKAERGDIIVFRSIELDNKRLVKRLIGLPGETIEVKEDGSVIIDGEKLNEPYVVESAGQVKDFKVPENCYFFLGDNRPISYDARFWINPYISRDQIIGKVLFRFFPFNRIGKVE